MMLKEKKFLFFLLGMIFSFLIVGLGQPAYVGWLGYIASFGGYAIFWIFIRELETKKKRFFWAFSWFTLVHAIGLSWMTSTRYLTGYILILYVILLIIFGIQFGLITLLIPLRKAPSYLRVLAISGAWVLLEWARLFILSGYTWNPIGLHLTNNDFSIQMVSIFGLYGLSFWVMMNNCLCLKAYLEKSSKTLVIFLIVFLFPYLWGAFYFFYHGEKLKQSSYYNVVLVQPAILPHQRSLSSEEGFVSPLYQWKRLLYFVRETTKQKVDFIIFPESCVPFGAYYPFYTYESAKEVWESMMGEETLLFDLLLYPPFAYMTEDKQWFLSNSFFAQAIADYYNAEVILGLEDFDILNKKSYNSAFLLQPYKWNAQRYDKQVLVPLGEYFPFQWAKKIGEKFGITDQFSKGIKTKVVQSNQKIKIGLSICYEETYGNLIRKAKKQGASLFVNVSNDAWFPQSKLSEQHYILGRLRAIENGVPLIRACNTGITAGVNALGEEIARLKEQTIDPDHLAGAIHLQVPKYHFATLYSFYGDKLILFLSAFFVGIFFFLEKIFFKYKVHQNKKQAKHCPVQK
jgi:apolipoprotein N-acyltransferase